MNENLNEDGMSYPVVPNEILNEYEKNEVIKECIDDIDEKIRESVKELKIGICLESDFFKPYIDKLGEKYTYLPEILSVIYQRRGFETRFPKDRETDRKIVFIIQFLSKYFDKK